MVVDHKDFIINLDSHGIIEQYTNFKGQCVTVTNKAILQKSQARFLILKKSGGTTYILFKCFMFDIRYVYISLSLSLSLFLSLSLSFSHI